MLAVFWLVCIIISVIVTMMGIGVWIKQIKKEDDIFAGLTTTIIGGCLVVLFLIFFLICCFKIIDAGEVGIQVKFGRVLEKTLTEGFSSKSPFAKVYTYSIRMKEYTMSSVSDEGDKKDRNDSISCRTLDNSQVSVDATILWAINPQKASAVYKQVSKNEKGLIEIVLRPIVRTLIRDQISKYKLDEVMKKREHIGLEVTKLISNSVGSKGILVDKVLIRDIVPPAQVDASIQQKLKAEQELQAKEFELQKADKDAEIRRVEAKGIADAQEIIQKKLTPLYVQYEAIQKYGQLANSPNTTFIILPTSTNGAGMPLILNAQK